MSSVYFTFQSIRALGQTYAARIGPPDECTSALGLVAVGFSWLEQSIERNIATLARVASAIAPALTAELSYKMKLAVLSSLVRAQPSFRAFNVGSDDPEEVWSDIVKMLSTCEDFRNQLLHSHWQPLPGGGQIRRTKTTAKAARGVRVVTEDLTADYLLDVYDYILNVEWALNEFFHEA
jgi:hypothetical protein